MAFNLNIPFIVVSNLSLISSFGYLPGGPVGPIGPTGLTGNTGPIGLSFISGITGPTAGQGINGDSFLIM